MNYPLKQKLYCFVDETGQETEGHFFLVSVVIADQKLDLLRDALNQIEQVSKKKLVKWRKALFEARLKYIDAVLANPLFRDLIFYAEFSGSQEYFDLTIKATVEAIRQKNISGDYTMTITVDGLKGEEIDKFKRFMRLQNVNVRKVRGARDESEPLIRLADAFAGFIRDHIESQPYAKERYEKATRLGVVRKL